MTKKVISNLCTPKLRIAKILKLIIQVYIFIVHQSLVSIKCANLSAVGKFPPDLFTEILKSYREKEIEIINYWKFDDILDHNDLKAFSIK